MARVWAGQVVETHNLEAQISALRAAFGADRDLIRTVARRGYQFTGEIRGPSGSADAGTGTGSAAAQPAPGLPPTNLPELVSDLIGRDEELREILNLAASHQLVTLTGPGGIGKTRLALAAARRLLPQFADGGWVAELAPLADPALVPAAVAAALGLEFPARAASAELVAHALSGKELLLVLDNCEHVIDAATRMAEALLRATPAVHVIATSREPLKAEGEWINPVPPLAGPAAEGDDPWRYGAVLAVCRPIARERRLCCRRWPCRGVYRGDLPAARWHPAGDRAGSGARRRVRHRDARRPPRRSFPAVDRRSAHRTAAAPDDAGDSRLELRTGARA
jgi:hypothetical protein